MFRVYVAFLKKSSAKNFLAERFLGVFKNSALDRDLFSVERFAFYLFGVCSNNFNITTPELGCRHCRLGVCGNNFYITNTELGCRHCRLGAYRLGAADQKTGYPDWDSPLSYLLNFKYTIS